MSKSQYFKMGWCRFKYDESLMEWIIDTLPFARETIVAKQNFCWLRCGGTWFAGVNVLTNGNNGAINASGPIRGIAVDFIRETLGYDNFDWDQGQVSVCYPGYPRPMPEESEAAFRYRRDRDAAHIDGLLPEGPDRHRHLREYHGFILGIPMVDFSSGASPLVLWEGSHEIIRETFIEIFQELPAHGWGEVNITEAYHEVRRKVFDRCKRVEIHARPGEAYLLHRFTLHGISPWQKGASATGDGRMITYFRPQTDDPEGWLINP